MAPLGPRAGRARTPRFRRSTCAGAIQVKRRITRRGRALSEHHRGARGASWRPVRTTRPVGARRAADRCPRGRWRADGRRTRAQGPTGDDAARRCNRRSAPEGEPATGRPRPLSRNSPAARCLRADSRKASAEPARSRRRRSRKPLRCNRRRRARPVRCRRGTGLRPRRTRTRGHHRHRTGLPPIPGPEEIAVADERSRSPDVRLEIHARGRPMMALVGRPAQVGAHAPISLLRNMKNTAPIRHRPAQR